MRWLQRQQHRKTTQRLVVLLGACIMLFTFPYLAFNASLIRLCSPACTLRRLAAALGSEDPQFRRAVCSGNQSAQLLRAFGLRLSNLSQPTYVWLKSPADVSGSCLDLATRLSTESSNSSATSDACFSQSYSPDDRQEVYAALHRLQQNFTQRGLQIFMSDGSLLGSQRHFGIIPWDDDIDFMILREQKFEVSELLIQLSHQEDLRFNDTERINFHWQLGILCHVDKSKPHVRLYGLLLPQKVCKIIVDLFFGDVLGDHFLRPEMPYMHNSKDVYPLRLQPFGPYLMWGPANPRAITAAQYGSDYEFSCLFEIHSQRFRCREKFLECDRLRRVYPFVTRAVLRWGRRSFSADVLVWKSRALAIFVPPQKSLSRI